MNRFIGVFLTLFVVNASFSQTPLTADSAYAYLQDQRARARVPQQDQDKPPADSLRKAEKILLDALVYYERADVQALAKTSKSLFARKGDISFDLGLIQAKMGQTETAAKTLAYVLTTDYATAYADRIETMPALRAVRSDPALAPQLKKINGANRVFNSAALRTPYQVNIPEDEKIAGLSKLWSEAKYNFAYFDHVPDLDWDKLYLDYLPKIRATRSTADYVRVLALFCAQLHDGHTDVWANDPALADSLERRPPIRTMLVDDKVLVQDVLSDSLLKTGIRPMMELVSIDGLPAKEYADRYVKPYQSGSTQQNVDVATYAYELLKGHKDKPVTLGFRERSDGVAPVFTRTLPRTGYTKLRSTPAYSFTVLPGNVAYVQLNTFDNNEALTGFKRSFDSIATTNALILDVRLNSGGNSGVGWDILGYLTDKPMQTGSYSSRIYSPLRRARGEGVKFENIGDSKGGWPAKGTQLYSKPVVVLTSGRTFSAAEDLAVVFDYMKRGTIIGEPTGGSTGQPLSFNLPGGVMARVCTKRDAYPDGKEWNGKGIQPTILVKPTVADLQRGRDPVLEAALTHLGAKQTTVKETRRKSR